MQEHKRSGFTLMELLVVITVILILVTTAVPFYKKQVMLAHETAALRSIQTVQVSEAQYMADFGEFASNLKQLGPVQTGSAGPEAADLIPQNLAEGRDHGYEFALAGRTLGYRINAEPEGFNSSGRYTYYSDESLAIRRNSTPDPATAASPLLK
ncbi:MAG TPA: type II secretion system protein [Bryobacteraceae bacterium]|jgi:type IV pilus assembly protein PilA